MAASDIVSQIKSGEFSRLIPVVADMSKEERAVSPVLAVFSMVPSFANSMLEEVGGPTNQRAKVRCYSQVVFKDGPGEKKLRPDGMIVVDSGRKVWSALVEAKIGNAELSPDQIEGYLELARHHGVDAVITVSNQFAAVPTHHPISVNKQKLRSVELYHFSWLSLLTKATLLADSKKVDDPEQAFLLKELIRYLSHSASGVCQMSRVSGSWKEVCAKVQTGTPLSKSDPHVLDAVSDWHQLTRFLALELSAAVGKPVALWLPRAQQQDPTARQTNDLSVITSKSALHAELDIPNAASRLLVEADFLRRSVRFSTSVDTPQDKTRSTAIITWATRQLPKLSDSTNTLLRLRWPGRASDTVATLADANADPKCVAPDDRKGLPTSLDVQRVVDLAARFKGASTFVEDIKRELPSFYRDVVQNVSNWVPKPPKMSDGKSPKSVVGEATVEGDDSVNGKGGDGSGGVPEE